jgi:parvulin-like peptidyl-prolyl isomerase
LGPGDHWLREHVAPSAIARVNDQPIPQAALAEALRAQLWRRGEHWDSLSIESRKTLRDRTLQHLIDAQLLRNGDTAIQGKASDEVLWFQRQLDFQEDRYAEALSSQQLTESQLHAHIVDNLRAQAGLESKLDLTVTDDEARAWFAAHSAELQAPEVWRASHLFLTSHDPAKPDRRAEIEAFAQQLSAGTATFDDLIAKHSDDDRTKLRDGDLGWFSADRMPPEFIAAVRTLSMGKLSAPVQTKIGWHLVKLLDHKPARALTFEETKDEIVARLQNERRVAAVEKVLRELRESARIERDEALISATNPAP